LLVLCRAALDDAGINDHARHLYVAADDRMATFVLKRTPFSDSELDRLDAYINAQSLRAIYSPRLSPANPFAAFIATPGWLAYVDRYGDDISPPTDDRPFFFYTLKPAKLLQALLSPRETSLANLGLVLLVLALFIVGVLVLAFLVLPLFVLRRDVLALHRAEKSRYLAYFMAIGVGFMAVEMSLMQSFVRVLGQPALSLVVVLFALLVAGGIGSFCSRLRPLWPRFTSWRARLWPRLLVVALLPALAGPWSALISTQPLSLRILGVLLLLLPVGFALGAFLPLGIAAAGERLKAVVPWAWGLNGAASVLGSVLAVVLAMNVGFLHTMLVGVVFYALAVLAARSRSAS